MQWAGHMRGLRLRTLGIVGLDFCGSTVVSNVLSSMPGVLNIGESHWIIDRGLGCRECHNQPCPVFTRPMLGGLRSLDLESNNWWEEIAKYTDAELIVSSDKLPKHYDRFGVPDYLLFLHKDPKSNIVSWCKRKFRNEEGKTPEIFSSEQITRGVNWWVNISNMTLKWLENQEADISTMALEDFSEDPRRMTKSLCGWLGVEYDPTSIDFWKRDLHYIGGNHSVRRMGSEQHFYQMIAVDERWRLRISQEDSERIENDNEINGILQSFQGIARRGGSRFFRLP